MKILYQAVLEQVIKKTKTWFEITSKPLIYIQYFTEEMVLDHFWPILIIVSLYCIIPIPLTILFSVKNANSKEGKAQPPRGLHFHNDLPIDE